MDQVDHLHAAEVVAFVRQDVAPRRSDQVHVRVVVLEIVNRLEAAAFKVLQDGRHASLGLAEENAVGVQFRFLRVQGGPDAAENDLFPHGPEAIGDRIAARHLTGQHAGEADQIAVLRIIDFLHVFIEELDLGVGRQGGSKHRRDRAAEDGIQAGSVAWPNADKSAGFSYSTVVSFYHDVCKSLIRNF